MSFLCPSDRRGHSRKNKEARVPLAFYHCVSRTLEKHDATQHRGARALLSDGLVVASVQLLRMAGGSLTRFSPDV